MKYTSAEAAKLLRKLNETHAAFKSREEQNTVFVAAIEEILEDARPAYNYEQTQETLAALEQKIRKVKHAINVFNATTQIPGFDLTIDEALVYIPQLSARKRKLAQMALVPTKARINANGYMSKGIVEYRYANYDVEKAASDLSVVSDELARLQVALDVVNNSVTLEIEE